MPNALTSTGLTTASQAELLAFYTAQLQSIYGANINLSSDSSDGQWINILIQANLDLQDLLVQIYNSFDPDNAIGTQLDQRVTINGISRNAGTYSTTNITLVITQSVNLYGLDQTAQTIYTVSDSAGNQWQLITTQLGVGAGTYTYPFQAVNIGSTLTTPNTITTQVTIVLGVQSVNNPSAQLTIGANEESDAALRIRRLQSVTIASQGYLSGLLAALENINGVSSAYVYENTGSSTNNLGVPGHSIWVIVAGTGSSTNIANAIYQKRNAGCGMFGAISYTITQVDGTPFTVYWDAVVEQGIFIAFTASSINGTNLPNIAAITAGLPTLYVPSVNQEVNINQLATYVQQIDPNTLVTGAGLSYAIVQTLVFSGIPASGTFKLSYNGNATTTIQWNASASTIQGDLRSVSGLAACTVTGSIASQSLVVTLNVAASAAALIIATTNSLLTAGSAAITVNNTISNSNVLSPTSQKYQFTLSSANIVILPMILSPVTVTLVELATQTFVGVGGYGTITYTLTTNASGGSINSTTGVYTAGSGTGTDVVTCTDALGNIATGTITVVV